MCDDGCATNVQIGQLASTRADFLPPQYYDRVKMLQSDTPAEPLDYIRCVTQDSECNTTRDEWSASEEI